MFEEQVWKSVNQVTNHYRLGRAVYRYIIIVLKTVGWPERTRIYIHPSIVNLTAYPGTIWAIFLPTLPQQKRCIFVKVTNHQLTHRYLIIYIYIYVYILKREYNTVPCINNCFWFLDLVNCFLLIVTNTWWWWDQLTSMAAETIESLLEVRVQKC